VTLPARFVTDGSITVEFETIVDSPKENESSGFDNIKITASKSCGRSLEAITSGVEELAVIEAPRAVVEAPHHSDCEEISKLKDIHPVPVDKCTDTPSETPITILSQDGDTVTFTVSQAFLGCNDEQSWLATDFVNQNDQLVCLKQVECHHAETYTAQCEDAMTVIDLYAFSVALQQTDGSQVSVPDACHDDDANAPTSHSNMCHLRYLVRCTPSLCKTPTMSRIGSSLKKA
jgi:hypothetical protein